MGLGNFARSIADRFRRSPTEFKNSATQSPYSAIDDFVQPSNVSTGRFRVFDSLKNLGNTIGLNRLTRTSKTNELYTAGITTRVNELARFTAQSDGTFRTQITIRNNRTGIIDTKTIDLTRQQALEFENNPQGFAENNLSGLDRYVGSDFEVVEWNN